MPVSVEQVWVDAGSGTITYSGWGTAEHVYVDSGSGTITFSGGTSTTGSVPAVTFDTRLRLPDRGEHSTPGQFTTPTVLPRLEPPPRDDPVLAVTDIGLVVVFVAVTGWSLVAVWVDGRWIASFRSRVSALYARR